MDVRVITLRYQEGLQGFPEEALRKAISGREVLEAREHFFVHGNTPHMALTLLLGDAPTGGGGEGAGFRRQGQGPDPEETLEEPRRPLYRDLKRWRNEQSKSEGKPAYAIARNVQLAEIARRAPRSLAELKEIDGVGEAFCRDYGAKVLGLIPEGLGPAPERAPERAPESAPEGGDGDVAT
jgi:superfamily II DNA helicase RecQ